ncbi:hypothetical protein P154DRAFT_574549 [Amniculicola lignicola CBS 123094]|uniref:Uncharacterized protein n=1 Tax=Amniculicola lignicola CBS 123094 TaxID=1392246 RepID=A0A6A5WNW2_9PLEO|nr:hypothetical protein P154DRAFT_574549 [Amniculicola lignicola CBS 123094]
MPGAGWPGRRGPKDLASCEEFYDVTLAWLWPFARRLAMIHISRDSMGFPLERRQMDAVSSPDGCDPGHLCSDSFNISGPGHSKPLTPGINRHPGCRRFLLRRGNLPATTSSAAQWLLGMGLLWPMNAQTVPESMLSYSINNDTSSSPSLYLQI